jgi:hypothetical protein
MRQRQFGYLHLAAPSLLFGAGLHAQVINSISTTATQALVKFTASTKPACTIQVSENANFSPLDADVDPTLFANANTESAHLAAAWVSGTNTTRTLRIGLRKAPLALDGFRHSRALAAGTKHYFAVTCNGSTTTATFTTGVPGGIAPEPPPTDSAAWGQAAFPQFTDFSKPVIEPHTGMKIYSADPSGWSSSQTVPVSANWFTGGNGWINTANIGAYGAAVAMTGNTNPIAVYLDVSTYADGLADVGGYWPYDNFLDAGLDLYGSGSDGNTAANRTIQACLSLDSGQTCYTPYASFTFPAGSDVPAGTMPSQYPSAYFAGWGKPLPRNAWPKRGLVSASAGVVTLTLDSFGNPIYNAPTSSGSFFAAGAYFNQDWSPGTKIHIAGSSTACTNNFCTIASVQSGVQLTLVENLTLPGNNAYESAGLVAILNKTTATGSVNISARWHLAKGYPHNLWTGGCAPTAVTSGDGISGYPCIFPAVRQNAGALYLVGVSQPVIRLISLFVNSPANCTNGSSTDCPSGVISLLGPTTPQFDPGNPALMYVPALTNGGALGLFKVTYSGNWTAYSHPYASSNVAPVASSELSWTNLTPTSTHQDLRTQILANTNYNETTWPPLTRIQTAGITGPYAIFNQSIGGQNSACWIFAFTAATGVFYKAWRTDDGSSNPILHFTGCHAIEPVDGSTTNAGPAVLIANDNLLFSNNTVPLGGPFSGVITAVSRGGVFGSNTALVWPPDNSYDNACPAGLPQWIIHHGAAGNQCVTVQLTQPCSSFATAGEIVSNPCPYASTTKSSLGSLAAGDFIKDPALGFDAEGMMVVQILNANTYVFQRNANFSYCALGTPTSTPPKDGVLSSNSSLTHANGWSYTAVSRDSCFTTLDLLDIVGGNIYTYNQNIIRGHFDLTEAGVQSNTMIGSGASNILAQFLYPIQFQRSWPNISSFSDFSIPQGPAFAGYQSDQGTQSYIDAKQFSAAPALKQYAFDFRHYDPNTGVDLEFPNQELGSATNATPQSGTTSVYLLSFTGTADVKRQALNVWAGEKYFIDMSSSAKGNIITDSNPWTFCYAYNAGECRTGSSQGALYAVIPRIDAWNSTMGACWESQINLRVPCAFAGPTQGMNATQVRVSTPDPKGIYQRWLGQLLMVPEAQYVYSKVLPTPDASYLLFGGFLTSGYHTGLMMASIPPFPNDSMARSTYVPMMVNGSGRNVYIEFGYDEFGSDGVTKFYCTTRAENCRVASAAINEGTPFSYASESLANANGYSIAIPALPGHVLYYRVVTGGVAGLTQVAAVP